jgi:hypothetical protein
MVTIAEITTVLDQLVADAQKFATVEPTFLTELTTAVAAVKAVIPTSTLKGLEAGAVADLHKFEALFKKK